MLLALVATGCAGAERPDEQPAAEPRAAASTPPAWLGGEYADGTLEFRFPSWWTRSTSETWGQLLSDGRSRHPAFISVRYLERGLPDSHEGFARLAGRTLRPPAGRGLTLLYTQTTYLGQRRGFEATFVWQTRATTPLGPVRSAFVVLAADRPPLHAGVFGWVRKTIRWSVAPSRAAGAVIPPRGRRSYGRFEARA